MVVVCVQVIVEDHPLVLGIRDVESVQNFQEKLKDARRIMVVGNGGIATEIVCVCVCVCVCFAFSHITKQSLLNKWQ